MGRPKIGLVLSGGGARGLAHVGVLKELEAARIPVDFVAGTSMGSIVGGLYASGMTPAELERRILAMNWDAMFADRPPREELSLRRKADDLRLSIPIEIGMRDGGLRAPRAAVGSSGLETMLKRLTEGVPGEVQFDRMPIPFRAVATDLVSGEAVVFEHGELAAVMRASMSVPAAFAPVEIGGKLLVDGGLVDNLPVDVVRKMGADIVIAVNIGTPLLPREELGSILGIGMQMLNILTEQNVRTSIASLKSTDVLIVPDLAQVTSMDFKLGADAIARGAEATRGVLPLLSNYALAPSDYVQQLAVQRRVATPSRIDEVRIEGTEYTTADVIRAQLSVTPGAPFSRRQIERDLAWLQGRGDFERLDYRLITERDRNVLLVHVREKPWGPNYFRFGLSLGTDFRGEGAFNLIGNHTRRWLNSYGGEWRNELQIGRTQRLSTEFYQPLQATETLFASVGAERERRIAEISQQLPDGSTSRALATFAGVDTRVWFDLGTAFGRYGELRVGPYYERVSISPKVAPLNVTGLKSIDSGFHVSAVIDQRDSAAFARAGYRVEASFQRALPAFGATTAFSRYQWSSEYAHTFGANTVDVALKFGGLYSKAPSAYPYFELGGFLQLSGLRAAEMRGDQVALGRIMAFRRIGDMPAFGRGIYAGGSLEVGRIDSPNNDVTLERSLFGGSVFLGLDTSLGPFYIGYGHASGKRRSAYLMLGRP
jgi:NTE family protein